MKWAMVLVLVAASGCTQDSKAKRRVFGEIEVQEIDVASRLPARVRRLAVKPGQRVKAGDVLVEFEDDVLAAKRKQAEALRAGAASRRAIALDAVRPEEKAQLKAAVAAARKQAEFAESSLARAKSALDQGAISRQGYEEIEMKAQAAKENVLAMEAKQRMARVGARSEEKAGAAALLDQASSAVAEVEAYAKDMVLQSPIDGEVAKILSHEGELVPAGYPVITLLKADDQWVAFQVVETELPKFPMGQALRVNVPALGDAQVLAQVSYIAPMAGFAARTNTQDRGTFDLKTFELRASLPTPDPRMRPGMTVVVEPGPGLPGGDSAPRVAR